MALARLVAMASVIWLSLTQTAAALNPDRAISQYKITRWVPEAGAPAVIFKLAQDPTGFLWLTTTEGLFRFDGVTFERIPAPLAANVRQIAVPLVVSRKGEVWVWYRAASRLGVYREGEVKLVSQPPIAGYANMIAETPDGAIWVGLNNYAAPLLRFKDGRWDTFGSKEGVPESGNLTALKSHPDGSLWAAYSSSTSPSLVVRLPAGEAAFHLVQSIQGEVGRLALDRQARVWVATGHGTIPLTGPQGSPLSAPIPPALPPGDVVRALPVMFDRDGNLWMSDYTRGLMRVRPVANPEAKQAYPIERFTSKDGLTSDIFNELFEDREGNVWIGGTYGLTQLSNADVVAIPALNAP